jgi:hypothetical protein
LTIDPAQVQAERQRERTEQLDRQEALSKQRIDKMLQMRVPTADPARIRADLEQRRRDALAAKRGQYDPRKMPAQVRSDSKTIEG